MFFAAIVLLCTLFTGSSQKKCLKQIFFRRLSVVRSARVSAPTPGIYFANVRSLRHVRSLSPIRISDSPDQVVWENYRNESVGTGVSARSRRTLFYLRLLR